MKITLAILLLLVGGGTAGADEAHSRLHFGPGELIDGNCVIGASVEFNDGSVYQCQNNRTWTRLPSSCEEKMEAAMKAMEKDVGISNVMHNGEPVIAIVIDKHVLALWESTKQACWRER